MAVGVLHQPPRRRVHRPGRAQGPAGIVRPHGPDPLARRRGPHRRRRRAALLQRGRFRRVRLAQHPTVGVALAGCAVLVAPVLHQQRTRAPALDLELFRLANFRWANLATVAFGTAFSAMFFGSILFLTDVWGWSVLQAGFGVAPGPTTVGLLSPRIGKLAGRIGQRPLLIIGGILFAGSALYRLAFLDTTADYWLEYFPSMVLSGLGVACVFPQLSSAAAQALPPGRAGVGGAVVQAVRQFSGTFGVAITVAILGASGAASLGTYDRIWWLIAAGGIATSILVLPMATRHPSVDRVEAAGGPAVRTGPRSHTRRGRAGAARR
ncbi:MAG: MFS transporter [Acidimicrobiales bacterium]